jgi:beta-galactosidase/beta-glucuronidase
MVRRDWLCLNGEWQFEIDCGDSGKERGLVERELSNTIIVPFCPESQLSGVCNLDFMNAVWYRRTVMIPAGWAGKSVLLHFGACDYDTTVWVNGKEVARHRGGFTPFTCELAGVAEPGQKATIVVRARDFTKEFMPRGKQSETYGNHGCVYTRTTGIWQTVWMEPVAGAYMLRPRFTPDVANGIIRLVQPLRGGRTGMTLRAAVKDSDGLVCEAQAPADADFSPQLDLPIPARRRRLWSPQDPHLYDVTLELVDASGAAVDRVESYAGLRSVTFDGMAFKLNGKVIFGRLVLDQGFYPDGILTAPTDSALKRDIELSMAAGFNGARLHQKVFEERFLYHADKLGYMVWGEFPDWGCAEPGGHLGRQHPTSTYVAQWMEAVNRDYSHPAIVGWCPLNETYEPMPDKTMPVDDVTWALFWATRNADATRPVLDASGYSHRVGQADVYDSHDYEQDPARFKERQQGLAQGKPFVNSPEAPISIPYRGQPYFVSEFGGIWWNPDVKPGDHSWGYGERPKTIEEVYKRFEGLCNVLLDDPLMFGYCYTQLTDVFQEQNGVVRFDRTAKFDMDRLKKIQTRKAAIEK